MSTPEAVQPKSFDEINEDVKKLASVMKVLENYLTTVGLIGAGVGSLAAIPFGPLAFVSGAVIGAAITGGLKAYAQIRKKELEKELTFLQDSGHISADMAAEIRSKLEAIHSDDPKKLEALGNSADEKS